MKNQKKRDINIDRTRGIAVFAMLVMQYLNRFNNLKFLSRIASHNIDSGIVVIPDQMVLADIVAPAFFFFIAFSFFSTFQRRLERNDGSRSKTYISFVVRYLVIIGIGFIMAVSGSVPDFFVNHILEENFMFFPALVLGLFTVGIAIICGVFYLTHKKDLFAKTKKITITCLIILSIMCLIQGIVYDYGNLILKWDFKGWWDALPAIGTAGLLTLPLAETSTKRRAFAAVCFFAVYYIIFSIDGNPEIIDIPPQGGFIASIAWAVFFLAFSVIGDFYREDRENNTHKYLICLGVYAGLGILGGLFMPVCKGNVSPGYILVNLAVCPAVFKLVSLCKKRYKHEFLCWWGISPMYMYILQYILNDLVFAFFGQLADVPAVAAIFVTILATAVFTFLGYRSFRKKQPTYM